MIGSELTASMKRLVVMGSLVAATTVTPAAAFADDPPKIIPKLAESHRLDPAGGTVLLLGLCYEQQGRLASAWAALRSARAMARKTGRKDRSDVADEHLNAIEPRLGCVTVTVASGASVPGLERAADIDHVVLAVGDLETSLPWYERLLPLLGFAKTRAHVWVSAQGFAVDVQQAKDPSHRYTRGGVGLNHLAVGAASRAEVDEVARAMMEAGLEVPAAQELGAAYALFLKDPDGMRIDPRYLRAPIS